ncbi:MAG TPA: hypothetical protein VG013_26275 [Gemmataceae bacterium]|nr:hypothetical protein [Gemmataceae bacterium]
MRVTSSEAKPHYRMPGAAIKRPAQRGGGILQDQAAFIAGVIGARGRFLGGVDLATQANAERGVLLHSRSGRLSLS